MLPSYLKCDKTWAIIAWCSERRSFQGKRPQIIAADKKSALILRRRNKLSMHNNDHVEAGMPALLRAHSSSRMNSRRGATAAHRPCLTLKLFFQFLLQCLSFSSRYGLSVSRDFDVIGHRDLLIEGQICSDVR